MLKEAMAADTGPVGACRETGTSGARVGAQPDKARRKPASTKETRHGATRVMERPCRIETLLCRRERGYSSAGAGVWPHGTTVRGICRRPGAGHRTAGHRGAGRDDDERAAAGLAPPARPAFLPRLAAGHAPAGHA